MFLTDGMTLRVPRVKTVAHAAFLIGTTLYAGVLKPMPRKEAMYLGISAEIKRTKNLTLQERVLMHEYAVLLLQGVEELPKGMTVGLGCQVRGMMAAESSHFKRRHPVLARASLAA